MLEYLVERLQRGLPLPCWWSYTAMSVAKRRHKAKSDGTSLRMISLRSRRRTFILEKFITSTTLQKLPMENSGIKHRNQKQIIYV